MKNGWILFRRQILSETGRENGGIHSISQYSDSILHRCSRPTGNKTNNAEQRNVIQGTIIRKLPTFELLKHIRWNAANSTDDPICGESIVGNDRKHGSVISCHDDEKHRRKSQYLWLGVFR